MNADPIDDLCARLRAIYKHGGAIDCYEAADALQRLRAERHAATEECNLWHRRARELVAERDALAAIVRAADAMRHVGANRYAWADAKVAYDAARAKWEDK